MPSPLRLGDPGLYLASDAIATLPSPSNPHLFAALAYTGDTRIPVASRAPSHVPYAPALIASTSTNRSLPVQLHVVATVPAHTSPPTIRAPSTYTASIPSGSDLNTNLYRLPHTLITLSLHPNSNARRTFAQPFWFNSVRSSSLLITMVSKRRIGPFPFLFE